MIKIALLGSTGSIGRQVLNCVDRYPNEFQIVSLAAGYNAALLNEQIKKYNPIVASIIEDKNHIIERKENVFFGEESLLNGVIEEADVIFNALMGFSGIKAMIKAINLKKNICLANKESLVCAGEMLTKMAKEKGVNIIPVDSEHSAIWQCLDLNKDREFKNIIITASGGAFRNIDNDKLYNIMASEALKHPTWLMGKKITIDCATMVNKGFEVIEAKWLFNTCFDKIKVIVHPQSIVHSMVEFTDGAVISQMGNPTMELPIQLALTYPKRFEIENNTLSLYGKTLEFKEMDKVKYPCFDLVVEAGKKGGVYPCSVSSADEEVVKLYLEDKIKYGEIYKYLEYVYNNTESLDVSLENLLYTDKKARELVLNKYNGGGF